MFNKILSTISSRVIGAFASLIVLFLSTHYLGQSGRGEMAIFILGIAMVNLIHNIISGSAITYLIPNHSGKSLFLISILWNLLISLAVSPILIYFDLFPKEFLWELVLLSFLQGGNSFFLNYLLGREEIFKQNLLEIIRAVVNAVSFAIILMHLENQTIYSVVLSCFTAFGITFLVGLIINVKSILSDKRKMALGDSTKNLFRYGSLMQMNNISQMINYRFCYYVIEKKFGLDVLGIFSVVTNLAEMIWILCKSISNVFYSRIVNLKSKEEKINLTISMSHFSWIITLPAIVVLIFIPESIYQWAFGKDFVNFQPILIAMAPGVLSLSFFTILNHYFSGTGQNTTNIVGSIIGNIVTIYAATYFIPIYKNVGGGIATSLGYVVMLIFWIVVFSSRNKLKLNWLFPNVNKIKSNFKQ